MSFQPTIISYRSQSDLSSHFLNIEDLVQSNDFGKIKRVYDDIFSSVTAYDPNHVDSLIKVEDRLHNRILTLEKEVEQELKKKTTGLKAVGLSILTLGIRPLVLGEKRRQIENRIKETGKDHSKFSRALDQMKQRMLEKELHPKPKFMEELEKKRLKNVVDELIRLQSIPRIAESLTKVKQRIRLSKSHQIAFGRSLELQKQLKDTHYVINHGQNLELMLVNIIARKLKQEFEPTYYESFEPLRHDTALRHIIKDSRTIAWYKNKICKGRTDDHGLRNDLICGDCVLESTSSSESALDFFSGKKNIAVRDNPSLVFNLILTIVQDYITNQEVAHKLTSNLVKLMNRCPSGGNLYSICVPKEKFDESCYFSKPFGVPLKNQEHLRGKIEEMQSGKNPHRYPQIRILSHKIRAQDGYHVILNSTLTDDQLLKIDAEVSLSIQAALTGYRVQASPKILFS